MTTQPQEVATQAQAMQLKQIEMFELVFNKMLVPQLLD